MAETRVIDRIHTAPRYTEADAIRLIGWWEQMTAA